MTCLDVTAVACAGLASSWYKCPEGPGLPSNRVGRERAVCETAPMGDTDDGAGGLRAGQRVKVRVRSHQPWGLSVEIVGHKGVGASIDNQDIAGPRRGSPRPGDFPDGAEIEAVIRNRLSGLEPPRWYYLTIP
jgi:hypothetical protein